MPDRIRSILRRCAENSARSVFASDVLNDEGGGSFRAYSLGSRPEAVDGEGQRHFLLNTFTQLGQRVFHLLHLANTELDAGTWRDRVRGIAGCEGASAGMERPANV